MLLIPVSFAGGAGRRMDQTLLAVLTCSRSIRVLEAQLAMRRIDLGIMYLGYLAIATQLVLKFLDQTVRPGWVPVPYRFVSFALGAMGLVIPAVIVRIAKGHTGRKGRLLTAWTSGCCAS